MTAAVQQQEEQVQTPESGDAQSRAYAWSLLGALLTRVPDHDVLNALRAIPDLSERSDDSPHRDAHSSADAEALRRSPMGMSWQALRAAAVRSAGGKPNADATDSGLAALDDEYHSLFIGVGRGEILPYASWYITGFLMDKPLAALRDDLAALGFERNPDVSEPEDHAGALCETMAMIISEAEISEKAERTFFNRHIEPWMTGFFHDLAAAKKADFYRSVGQFGAQFLDVEREYLSI